jgi:hypothetical protein
MKITWKQNLGDPTCSYLRRWVLDCGWFSLRVHHWISSDDDRYFHDHPWWYWTFCLFGGYTDVSEKGNQVIRPFTLHYFPAEHKHSVRVGIEGAWTLLLTGPEKRVWGFWVDGKFRKRNKYFFEFGHHQCEGTKQ